MRRALLASAVLALLLPLGVATAKPVTRQGAQRAIRADRLNWPTPPVIAWCAPKHYGTICETYVPACYIDRDFGASTIDGWNLVWVSRTRRQVSVAILGSPWSVIWAADGCTATRS